MKPFPTKKALGFGAMRLPLMSSGKTEDIDVQQVERMVDLAIANDCNYFDTAYPYHKEHSEMMLRETLVKRHPRNTFLLADKMPCYLVKTTEDYPRFFETQRERCGVDYFDFYLLHNLSDISYKKIHNTGGFDFIQKIKAEGHAKYVGFSFHDQPEVLETILSDHPEVDFVQLQINYADMERPSIKSRECMEIANAHNIPIIVMEPLKGGALANLDGEALSTLKANDPSSTPAQWGLRFAASCPGVFLVLSGMSNMEQLQENLKTFDDFKPLTQEEYKVIDQVQDIIDKANAIPCTSCNYCVDDCPMKINIPKIFSILNMVQQFGNANFPTMHYQRSTHVYGKASDCISCGACERHCPQHIKIIKNLKLAVEKFE